MSKKYRLQKIDELLLPSHKYLEPEDECFFFMNYTPLFLGLTAENDIILNFKKGVDKQAKPAEWKWKTWAINYASELFIQNIPPLKKPAIFIPIPPSKHKDDPMYDNRVVQLVRNYCNNNPNAELREIISLNENMTPTHQEKMNPDEILPFLIIDKSLCADKKNNIVLVDDVITDGAHFKACQTLLRTEFPKAKIKGLFIARTIH